jgi:hypothetical protein
VLKKEGWPVVAARTDDLKQNWVRYAKLPLAAKKEGEREQSNQNRSTKKPEWPQEKDRPKTSTYYMLNLPRIAA